MPQRPSSGPRRRVSTTSSTTRTAGTTSAGIPSARCPGPGSTSGCPCAISGSPSSAATSSIPPATAAGPPTLKRSAAAPSSSTRPTAPSSWCPSAPPSPAPARRAQDLEHAPAPQGPAVRQLLRVPVYGRPAHLLHLTLRRHLRVVREQRTRHLEGPRRRLRLLDAGDCPWPGLHRRLRRRT